MTLRLSAFLQWPINIHAYRRLGWRWTLGYLRILGRLYFLIKRKEKRTIKQSVAAVFGGRMEKSQVRALTRAVFRGIVWHYYEKLFNAFAVSDVLRTFVKTHMTHEGLEALSRGLSRGRGVLLITGHFGGVELIPAFLGSHRFAVTIVAKFSSDRVRAACHRQAAQFSTRIIDADRTPNVLKAIADNLKENRIVVTQCDEVDEWRPSRNTTLTFLDKRVFLDKTINVLARRLNVPIVFGVMHRKQNHRYKFIVAPMSAPTGPTFTQPARLLGAEALKLLEAHIYKHPQEWYQWKKYPSMTTAPAQEKIVGRPQPLPVLHPSLENG